MFGRVMAMLRQNSTSQYSLVLPFSSSSGPSPSAYTGTTVTVYSVFGSRFFSSRVVVLSETCSCCRNGRLVTKRM